MPDLWGEDLSRVDLLHRLGRLEQLAGIRLVTLADGHARGVRVLEVRTGELGFDILVDRAFDIGRCDWRGIPIAWVSPAGPVGPWLAEQTPLGWLRSFGGGLVATCGLDHTQGPGEDHLPHAYAVELATEAYTQHGRVGTQPARLAGYGSAWEGDRCTFWAEGEVEQAVPFGERLVLRRRIEADLGGRAIRIRDEVENVGHAAWTQMQLYHCNVGWPLVDDGSELLVPATAVREIHDDPPGDYRRIGPPERLGVERVYEQELAADAAGVVTVALVNRRRELGLAQRFRREQLPIHNLWRMPAEGYYTLGLEPATNRDSGRWEARTRGELRTIEPGEVRRYDLGFEVLTSTAEIDAVAAQVAAIMAAAIDA
jgi:hypothetical protein